MKKFIALIAVIVSFSANAQQMFNDGIYGNSASFKLFDKGKTEVFFTYPMDFGIGYSHINMKDGFTSSWNGYTASNSFGMMEFICCGFYFAMGEKTEYTPYDVLGWTIRTSGDYFRFGFELGKLFWCNNRSVQSFSVTPFYGSGRCGLSDTSGNKIGWGSTKPIDNFRQHITHYGVKVAYSYEYLEIGLIASKNEISISLTAILNGDFKRGPFSLARLFD